MRLEFRVHAAAGRLKPELRAQTSVFRQFSFPLDSPKVRAAMFDDGKQRVALVGLDSLIIRRETALEARRRIADGA